MYAHKSTAKSLAITFQQYHAKKSCGTLDSDEDGLQPTVQWVFSGGEG